MSRFFQITCVVALAAMLLGPAHVIAQESGGRSSGNGPTAGERGKGDEGGQRRGGGGSRRNRERERNGEAGKAEDRESPRPASDAKQATTPTNSMGEKSEAAKADEYASTTIKKYDKNGDGMIQENEQEGMGSMTKKADTNGDHVITKNELVAMSLGRAPAAPATAPAPAASSSNSAAPVAVDANSKATNTTNESESTSHAADAKPKTASKTRKSYRFKPAKERLPSGLPSWFTSKDANGDAQVSMNEYGKSWNDRTAAEFQGYDRNNDGIITAAESQKAK